MRRTELDLCRIVGCLMVLVIHAGAEIYQRVPIYTGEFALLNIICSSVRGGVPIFFMLTGALMLSRPELDLKKLLVKHPLYLTGIFYLWSLIYALGSRVVSGSFGSVYDFVLALVKGHYHQWFLPAMVMCYLCIPLLHSAIHGKKLSVKYMLALFFGLVLLTSNMNLTPDTAPILHQITLNFSFDYLPYLGYVLWGWWLSTKQMPKQTLWLAPLVFVLCCLVTARGNLWYSNYKGTADGWLFSYFSLSSFVMASSVFCFCLSLGGRQFRAERLIRSLADCTLGVYLIHPLMINLLEKLGICARPEAPVATLCLLTAVLALLCFSVSFAAKRIPLLRKIM